MSDQPSRGDNQALQAPPSSRAERRAALLSAAARRHVEAERQRQTREAWARRADIWRRTGQ